MAALGADARQKLRGGFDITVRGAPVGGQATAEGGSQHTLTELLQQRTHFRKRTPRTRTPLLKRLDLRHDPTLLGKRGKRDVEVVCVLSVQSG